MASITIGNTSKRSNSTSQTFTGTTLNCRLKEPTSLHDPVFYVQGLTSGAFYNYASYRSRYFWVDDVIQMTNDISEVHCHLDSLATFKTAITNTYGLVMFGDSAHKTNYKDDPRFGPDIKLSRASGAGVASMDLGFRDPTNNSNWTVLMTVQTAGASYSSVCTYAMTLSTFQNVLHGFSGVVYSDIQTWSGTDILDILKNYAIRILTGGQQALDNIRACVAVPMPLSIYSSAPGSISQTSINLGPYNVTLDSGHTVYLVDPSHVKTGNAVLSLGRPLPNTGYKWLNSPKYCSVKITHPGGYSEINDPSLINNSYVYAWYSVGICSGEYVIRFTSEDSKDSDTISLLSGCVGVDVFRLVPSSNVTVDSNLHNSIGSALIQGGTGGVIQFNAGSNSPMRSGADIHGGYATIGLLTNNKTCFLDTEYYIPSIFSTGDVTEYEAYCNLYGYPVDRYLKIGDISGYCQCINVSVGSISGATEDDKNYINACINSGIYIE